MHTDVAPNRSPRLLLVSSVRERLAATNELRRLYTSLQTSFDAQTLEHDAGLTREMLLRLSEDEERHGALLRRAVVTLGASLLASELEPVTVAAVPQSLAQDLRTILFAKLQDVDGWETLTTLARELGYAELEHQFRRAAMDEQAHVTHIRQSLTQAVMEDPDGAAEPS
jgi:rubrerythrin